MHYLHCTAPGCNAIVAASDKPFAEHPGAVLCFACLQAQHVVAQNLCIKQRVYGRMRDSKFMQWAKELSIAHAKFHNSIRNSNNDYNALWDTINRFDL